MRPRRTARTSRTASGGEEVVAFGQRIPAPATLPDAQLLATLLSSQRYIVTPGDRYRLTLVLEQTARFDLTVQDDGVLEVPYLGTVETTGREYSDLRSSILESLRRIPADYMEFELVSPARFEVFVGGAVRLPGTMIVHAINRVQDAIRLAGGVDRPRQRPTDRTGARRRLVTAYRPGPLLRDRR